MARLSEVLAGIRKHAEQGNLFIKISGSLDLFPDRGKPFLLQPSTCFPAPWPFRIDHGLYLFLADDPDDPRVLYVGKASERTSCIGLRLNSYIDTKAKKIRSVCVLRDEWHGRRRPWKTEPRYVVTVGMLTNPVSGTCLEAVALEDYLIRYFDPPENTRGRRR